MPTPALPPSSVGCSPQPPFSPGDRVAWSVAYQVDGEGVIAGPLPPDPASGESRYEVAVFRDGRYTGHLLPLGAGALHALSSPPSDREPLNGHP